MTFYVHIDTSMAIVGVSPSEDTTHQNLAIEESLAIKFLGGEENPSQWSAALINGTLQIKKNPVNKTAFKKTDFSPLVKVQELQGADVEISRYFDYLTFKYSPRFLANDVVPPLFLTKRNDPTILIQNIDMSDKPAKVMIQPHLNISFYTQRSTLTYSL